MTDYSVLKRLAEAATPGPWYQHGGIMQVLSHDCETVCETFEDDGECPDAQFIAAANPAAVLALIAENGLRGSCKAMGADMGKLTRERNSFRSQAEKARAEVAGLRTGYEAYERVNAELKAEVEGLRKDADRYRWLRRAGNTKAIALVAEHWLDALDEAIDAALGQGEQP